MTVCLEVDTDIETSSSVVQVLDTSGGADHVQTQVLLHVSGGGSVGVCRLDNTNVELLDQTGLASEVGDEGGGKCSYAVTVQQAEDVLLVLEVEDDTVGITVERTTAVQRACLGRRGCTLAGLDEVCSTLESVSPSCFVSTKVMELPGG